MKLVPYAKTRLNIIPSPPKDAKAPRSVLLGAYTVRGCGVTKATFRNELLTGIHNFASISEELKNSEYTSVQVSVSEGMIPHHDGNNI
eukprot:12902352-Prorocentrum_lima.AAC.1